MQPRGHSSPADEDGPLDGETHARVLDHQPSGPLPMHRTSISSRPIPWKASDFASVRSTNGSQTKLWILSGYC